MTQARREWQCHKCKEKILIDTDYVPWKGHKYHIKCAPEEALKDFEHSFHYPTFRRAMKKTMKVSSVRGFFR